jgi:formylmethanofuran dehydrogenase subunit D
MKRTLNHLTPFLLILAFAFGCGSDELPDEELTVTGVVMNSDGGRVNAATVIIVDVNTNKQAAIGKTDTLGRFAIQIVPGNYLAYARGEQLQDRQTIKLEGMTKPFTIGENQLIPRMTVQTYNIVQIRSMCPLSEEQIQAHADKKGLIALFSTQKFKELGIKEEQRVKVTNLSTRQDIVVYAFQSDSILCEMSVPSAIVQKLLSPYSTQQGERSSPISVSLEVSIAAPELFR